jgi:hypothetical protein
VQELESLLIFTAPLDALGLRYFVTGSVASIVYGEPRLTNDIDLVLALRGQDTFKLVGAFPEDRFYCPPEEVLRLEAGREDRGHFNLIHHATGYKADVYLQGTHPLHAWAFSLRRRIALAGGASLWLAPPEYVILRKLEFFQEGGSPKHLRDIRGMLEASGDTLDRQELERWIARLGLQATWAQVQVDPRAAG